MVDIREILSSPEAKPVEFKRDLFSMKISVSTFPLLKIGAYGIITIPLTVRST